MCHWPKVWANFEIQFFFMVWIFVEFNISHILCWPKSHPLRKKLKQLTFVHRYMFLFFLVFLIKKFVDICPQKEKISPNFLSQNTFFKKFINYFTINYVEFVFYLWVCLNFLFLSLPIFAFHGCIFVHFSNLLTIMQQIRTFI